MRARPILPRILGSSTRYGTVDVLGLPCPGKIALHADERNTPEYNLGAKTSSCGGGTRNWD